MKKILKIIIILLLVLLVGITAFFLFQNDNSELKTVKSDKELLKIYNGDETLDLKEKFINVIAMPFSFTRDHEKNIYIDYDYELIEEGHFPTSNLADSLQDIRSEANSASSSSSSKPSSKDYSTTNIQVENVDEADITKTDGDYIYSISENNVIITNVMDPKDIKIEATISLSTIPEDLILYEDNLVVISTSGTRSASDTVVRIYNIATKSKPTLVKSYELYEPYYTSRCIDNKLYVIASGKLKKEKDKVVRTYKEGSVEKEIPLDEIKYLKDVKTNKQTIISQVDLNNVKANINISSYLIDITNAYVSENSIYLLEQRYKYEEENDIMPLKSIFGIKGVFGLFDYEDDYYYSGGYKTQIYKFDILEDGKVTYSAKTEIEGKTINQYSIDEHNELLRVALYDSDGARVAVFDKNLQKIGISDYVAKGETMYSSRFIGNKAYIVTYKTMDPLFVIDLSDETKPQVLGELHIPGYSTYLHPYDENHLIGIGMETKEVANRDWSGRVTSVSSKIIGMKMALFDISDVNNPIQISQTVIGDSRTTSAILTNPKALLFSKEKQLIAIPVNNYNEDFEINDSSQTHASVTSSYKNYNKKHVAEGYFVYNINVEDGFKLKGVITHEKTQKNENDYYYYYYNNSKLLRGLYIENNLYTVSEEAVKVNKLDTLKLVDELKIK